MIEIRKYHHQALEFGQKSEFGQIYDKPMVESSSSNESNESNLRLMCERNWHRNDMIETMIWQRGEAPLGNLWINGATE